MLCWPRTVLGCGGQHCYLCFFWWCRCFNLCTYLCKMVCGGLYQHHEGRKEGRNTSESLHRCYVGLGRCLVWWSASASVVLTAAMAIFPSITYLCEMVCGGLWQGQKGRIMRNGLQKRVLRPLLHLRRGPMLAKSRTATRFPLQQQIAQSALCGCLYSNMRVYST